MNSESNGAAVVMNHLHNVEEHVSAKYLGLNWHISVHEELQTVIFDIIKTLKLRYGSVLTSVKQQTP